MSIAYVEEDPPEQPQVSLKVVMIALVGASFFFASARYGGLKWITLATILGTLDGAYFGSAIDHLRGGPWRLPRRRRFAPWGALTGGTVGCLIGPFPASPRVLIGALPLAIVLALLAIMHAWWREEEGT